MFILYEYSEESILGLFFIAQVVPILFGGQEIETMFLFCKVFTFYISISHIQHYVFLFGTPQCHEMSEQKSQLALDLHCTLAGQKVSQFVDQCLTSVVHFSKRQFCLHQH